MNLKQLSTVVLVAELGSLSRAATATDTAQSLVSRQIALLEQEWGDRLFERTQRGAVLSSFGRRVLPEIRLALEQMSRLEGAVKDAAGVLSGTVHVGVVPSMVRQLLPALFADLRTIAPAIKLRVMEGFSGDLDDQLGSGHLDVMLVNRYGSSASRGEDLLGVVDTWLIGKPGSAVLAEQTVGFRQLEGLPLVLPAMPNGLRSTLDHLASRHRVRLEVVMEVDTSPAMMAVASSGQAFTLLPLMAVVKEVAHGDLAASRIVRPSLKRTIALSLTKQRPVSKAARLVATRIRHLAMPMLAG